MAVEESPSVVRSEERLVVASERVPVARVRIGKRVVERTEQVEVVVRREELYVEEEPYDAAADDIELHLAPGAAVEMVLAEEQVEVVRRVVPRERVRARLEVVTHGERYEAELAREVVEADGPGGQSGPGDRRG